MAGRALAWLQAPVGSARPTLGLVASLAPLLGAARRPPGRIAEGGLLASLCQGRARAAGLWSLDADARPLTELALQLPLPLALALQAPAAAVGGASPPAAWPGLRWLDCPAGWPASLQQAAQAQAEALQALGPTGVLVLRSGHPHEAREAAAAVAAALGRWAIGIDGAAPAGLGAWLGLQRALPVQLCRRRPGRGAAAARRCPAGRARGWSPPAWKGSCRADGDTVAEWAVPLPLPAERAALWSAHCRPTRRSASAGATVTAPRRSRNWAARPATSRGWRRTGSRMRRADRGRGAPRHPAGQPRRAGHAGAVAARPRARRGAGRDAGAARRAGRAAPRCERRDGLADALGPAARARYRPGVRALLVGAVGHRQDAGGGLAGHAAGPAALPGRPGRRSPASTSARPRRTWRSCSPAPSMPRCVLLFDEADSLFGKRTEVQGRQRPLRQPADQLPAAAHRELRRHRAADQQQPRALRRRLHAPARRDHRLSARRGPTSAARCGWRIWVAHHGLDDGQLNRIAAACDLAGGHIRNVVAARALAGGGPIGWPALARAVGRVPQARQVAARADGCARRDGLGHGKSPGADGTGVRARPRPGAAVGRPSLAGRHGQPPGAARQRRGRHRRWCRR